jgi:NADH:ubiquinone oxidoreductase subunit F (NADH-binding)
MARNPYAVVEGLAIASYAVGAAKAYVGIKESFEREAAALERAIVDFRTSGLLGEFPVSLVLGPDLYLFGEETGLLEVVEGRAPLPRILRPFMQGLFADATRSIGLPWRISRSVHGMVSPVGARYFNMMAMERPPSPAAVRGQGAFARA